MLMLVVPGQLRSWFENTTGSPSLRSSFDRRQVSAFAALEVGVLQKVLVDHSNVLQYVEAVRQLADSYYETYRVAGTVNLVLKNMEEIA